MTWGYERELLPVKDKPRKLRGKEREAEIMRLILQMQESYKRLNKIFGIGLFESLDDEDNGNG